MKKTLIGMFALALILGATTVSATPGVDKGLRGDSPRLSRLQQTLDLSDEQVDEIRAIRANGGSRDDVRAVLSDEQRAMLDTRRARRRGMREGNAGRWTAGEGRGMRGRSPRMEHMQQALGLSDEQAAEIRELRASGGSRDDIRAVLTDEQRALMDEHRANRQGRRDGKGWNWRARDGYSDTDDTAGTDEIADPAAR